MEGIAIHYPPVCQHRPQKEVETDFTQIRDESATTLSKSTSVSSTEGQKRSKDHVKAPVWSANLTTVDNIFFVPYNSGLRVRR